MRVFVSGAAGRVGSKAVDSFLAAGHQVSGFDMAQTGNTADRYSEVTGRLEDAAAVRRAVAGAEVVLHLGALMSWAARDRDRMFQANIVGTRTLLEAAEDAGVRRFVFASSGEVYPESAAEILPVTEQHPRRPNSYYGLTKLVGEEWVRFHSRGGTMETVILRFAHTQDAAELLDETSFFSGPRFFLAPKIRNLELIGKTADAQLLRRHDPGCPAHVLSRSGDGRPYMMHITDTRDIVAGLRLAAEHPQAAGKTFNLGCTEPVDFSSLLERMSAVTGYPVIAVDFPGPGVHYRTSNALIRAQLGYEPKWTIDKMLEEAAASRGARPAP